MSEIAAGTLPESRRESARPSGVRSLLWVALAGWMATLLGSGALFAPRALGVASFDISGHGFVAYQDGTLGAALANACALLVYLWAWTLIVRGLFRVGSGPEDRPAWTWTALTLAPAIALAQLPGTAITGPAIVAALALPLTAFAKDGTPRPEPFAPTRRTRVALGLALPVLALGGATAYAMYHPLQSRSWSGEDLKPGLSAVTVRNPIIENDGGRAVRILAVEPGVERGYALHLVGMKVDKERGRWPGDTYLAPLQPFTLGPHKTADDLSMVLSRAGCRPGTSGRIESVRVRYRLGGAERTQLLKLEDPITLTC